MQYDIEDHYDESSHFSAQNGLEFAFILFKDGLPLIDDPRYGEIVVSKLEYDSESDSEAFQKRSTIKSHKCTKSELG